MPGLLEGKRTLVTVVLTNESLAYGVAQLAIAEGAQVVLTGAGRGMSLTRRMAKRLGLDGEADVYEWDVTLPEHGQAVAAALESRWGGVDAALHAIGFAPGSCLGGGFLEAPWEDVAVALHISTYSLKEVAGSLAPLLKAAGGGSVVGLDFDATVAWPAYDWMGVAKAALESASRYLARDLGPADIRVNLVAAGPLRTVAARSIPGFAEIEAVWAGQAPLGWDVDDPEPAARAVVALLSDWFPATTGEIVHVDGGAHAMGAPVRQITAPEPTT
ncbi:MAG: enoyl-ACP reductase FabI [Acidimicrobiales bacterium]